MNDAKRILEGLSCICGNTHVYKSIVNVKGLEVNQLHCPECGIIMRSPGTDENGKWLEGHWRSVHMRKDKEQQATSQGNKISSHSERDIVLGCIGLIDEVLNGEFAIFEQLEADGFDFDEYKKRSECELGFSLTYFEIVQRLLLYHTSHSGGTSTQAKCCELGFDPSEYVSFNRNRNEDDEDDKV